MCSTDSDHSSGGPYRARDRSNLCPVPSDSFTHSVVVDAPVSEVWAAMDDPQTWASISGIDQVTNPQFADNQLVGFSFTSDVAGRTYHGKATPAGRTHGRSITWGISNSEIKGQVQIEMSPVSHGTKLTVNLEVESAGMMSRMFFPVIAGTIGNGLPRTVEQFATRFRGDA